MTSAVLGARGLEVMAVAQRKTNLRLVVGAIVFAAAAGSGLGSTNAQQLAARVDQQKQNSSPTIRPGAAMATASLSTTPPTSDVKPARRFASKGQYYVDFRARTAASYGHAFIWYGKTTEKKVEVAGLHPRGDTLPYILGHVTFVPADTGASYGDLDEQYLTASYRVYLNEADAKKVFGYIKHLQANSPVWNVETTNCTSFIGRVASFMGLKTPFHLIRPEEYVNQIKALNGGRQTVHLAPN
jgi:hypothetical protein